MEAPTLIHTRNVSIRLFLARLVSCLVAALSPGLLASTANAQDASNVTTRWEFDAGDKVIAKPTVADGTIYVAAGSSVHALDLQGQERWRRDLAAPIGAAMRVDEGTLYVHSSAGLHALDLEGKPQWTYDNEDRGPLVDGRSWGWGDEILADPWGWYRSAPLVLGDTVYFGSSDGVHAVSRAAGEPQWQLPIGPVTADLVAHEDLLIVASWNHSVYGVERDTGKLRWRFQGDVLPSLGVDWIGYESFHLTPIVEDGRVLVGNRNTYFYALDAKTGAQIWSTKVGASWIGSPAVAHDDEVYYALSDGYAVLGHRRDSGKQTLFFDTGSTVFAQPELVDDQLLVGTLNGRLFGVDIGSGKGRLLVSFGPHEKGYADYFDPKIIPQGLTGHEATAWSIDRWLTESNGILNLTVEGGVAYVGTASGVLYAVDVDSLD